MSDQEAKQIKRKVQTKINEAGNTEYKTEGDTLWVEKTGELENE